MHVFLGGVAVFVCILGFEMTSSSKRLPQSLASKVSASIEPTQFVSTAWHLDISAIGARILLTTLNLDHAEAVEVMRST